MKNKLDVSVQSCGKSENRLQECHVVFNLIHDTYISRHFGLDCINVTRLISHQQSRPKILILTDV